MKRKFLQSIVATMVMATLVGCGATNVAQGVAEPESESEIYEFSETTGETTGETTEANANEPDNDFIENTEYEKPESYSLENAVNLVDTLAESKDGNIVISETSLNMALGLLGPGAAGETSDSILTYLSNSHYAEVMDDVRIRDNAIINRYAKNENIVLNIANGVWTNNDTVLKESYINLLKAYYNAEANTRDFIGDTGNVTDEINDWVNDATNNKITSIVTPDVVRTSSNILVNALYFNGDWECEFDDDHVNEEAFTNRDGSESTVTMMYDNDLCSYYENDFATAFAKYYEGHSIAFVGILPKDENYESISSLKLDTLMANESYDADEVHIKMPKFIVEDSNTLSDVLSNGVLNPIFKFDANFSNMSDSQLFVDRILQKTYVDVNEHGTEAAAVTAVVTKTLSMAPSDELTIKEIYLDRPFVFMIYDFENNECLFIGKIDNMQ